MNTVPDWEEVGAFVDGELTSERVLEIEAGAKESASFFREIEGVRRLQACVREQTDYHRAPDALRLSILDACAQRAPSQAKPAWPQWLSGPGSGLRVLQRWFAWRPMASALAVAGFLVFSVNLTQSTISNTDQLQEDIVASHVRATMSHRLVDLASSDPHAVAPFLSARLDFSPPIQELTVASTSLVGGRVDYVDGRAVAAVVYRLGDHVVDSFVWPTSNGDSGVTKTTRRGYQLARWSRNGMAHCLISDASSEQLAAIVRQLEAGSPEQPSS